jgi:hypothetical protein
MWFRDSNSKLVLVEKKKYITETDYYTEICHSVVNVIFPKSTSVIQEIKSLINT